MGRPGKGESYIIERDAQGERLIYNKKRPR